MKTILIALLGVFLITSAFAQTEKSASDTSATSQITRADFKFMGGLPYQVQKGTSPKRVALFSDVVAATGSTVTQVNSVAPVAGNVTLTTANIAENTNLYYTQTRARAAISGTAPISYNSTTGVLTFSGTKSDVGLANVDNTSDAAKPVSTAQATAIALKENTINAGTLAQYFRGDKTFQTLNSSAVGLGSVDNTSDANKPVSTAQATAIGLKENAINAGTTAQYFRGDKTFQTLNATAVGLGSVDNTSDAAKPVSTAQATAIALKADATAVIPFSGVAAYSNLTGVTAPASGFLKFVRVTTDERYNKSNQLYMVDPASTIWKIALIQEN